MIKKGRRLFNRLRSNKDGRTLTSNFGYLFLLQISGYIFPLLTIPYLARVIGVDGFGKIAFAAGVMTWFITIADWGFNYTATRDVAKNKEDSNKVSEIFSNVFWAKLLLMLLSFTVLLILIVLLPYFRENKDILLISFLLVIGNVILPQWFFQAIERMKFITIFSLFSRLIFTVSVFFFINERSDFILQPLLLGVGNIICGMTALYLILVKWNIKLRAPKFLNIFNTIKNSTDVFINNLMPNLYNSFSIVLLGFFGGSTSNGILDAGNKLVGISQQFLTIISRVFFPLLSRKIAFHNIYSKLNLSLSVFASVTLFLLAPYIINTLYTDEFKESISVLRIMSFSIVFMAMISTYGTNYLIVKGHEKSLRKITTTCSIIGFIICFPLIYKLNFIGAALTITITRALLGTAVAVKAKTLQKEESYS